MIDLHCHLLPGVDDGPQNVDESIALAKKLVEDGVKQVVVTPHMLDGVYNVSMSQLVDGIQNLQEVLQNHSIDLQVFPGADIHINAQLVKLINEEVVPTIANNKKYILLEPDNNIWGDVVDQVVFSLQIKNITPIITHPERYHVVQEDMWCLKSLAEANVPIQVTAASICGFFGKKVQKCSRELFQNGLAHIVASDAHGVRKRPPFMTEARKMMNKWLAKDVVDDIFDVYPRKILNGEYIQLPPPQKKKRRWFFG
ncbi:tyrosine-protein phosphatase [Candidatus Uabimicrobium amorphum]|uniref:protein-tyrosine-phosphatase n=1 Tax=Uabimicrobium amorphum TaxID=2596890 RepID=A0A5S9IHP1_UABAM|nr:CpsB/CapC family capsule biosynthesis tyrosine phosphatase [Candidatus Uabimicrobium amorphum]BBM81676.1 tyrosine protein phosphatase [Candidatus Uabimicrobium amorphum]